MKYLCFLLFISSSLSLMSQVLVEEQGTLPVRVANNAVCEGFINGEAYLYSFGGIDSTKLYSGIHLKSYKYNIATGVAERIADLPDTMGKIAAGASRIGDVIYIVGGYHVFSNGAEVSSKKVHRYDVINDVFLSDAADLLVATDDHVQSVWRDSLLYVISGWSDSGNIANVQIYNPANNTWRAGIPVPNNTDYKSFGASGMILQDTIYYFGGAADGSFAAQNQLRKGIIDPSNSVIIDWSVSVPDIDTKTYRSAATVVGDSLYWIGGSDITYNFDGIAYNGSGGVATTNRVLYKNKNNADWSSQSVDLLPMDLRGLADVSESVKYIAGGMLTNQEVSNKVYKLSFRQEISALNKLADEKAFKIFPVPCNDQLIIENPSGSEGTVELYNLHGILLKSMQLEMHQSVLDVTSLSEAFYILRLTGKDWTVSKSVLIGS